MYVVTLHSPKRWKTRGGFFGVKRYVYLYKDTHLVYIEDVHLHTNKHAVLHQRIRIRRICNCIAVITGYKLFLSIYFNVQSTGLNIFSQLVCCNYFVCILHTYTLIFNICCNLDFYISGAHTYLQKYKLIIMYLNFLISLHICTVNPKTRKSNVFWSKWNCGFMLKSCKSANLSRMYWFLHKHNFWVWPCI